MPVGIPRSRQNPKILGPDDTQIIHYFVIVYSPFSGHLLTQKRPDRRPEIGDGLMTPIVCDVLVHRIPQPLDRIQVRAVGGDEMQPDPALRPRQPSLH
jgi:hypothetical protein